MFNFIFVKRQQEKHKVYLNKQKKMIKREATHLFYGNGSVVLNAKDSRIKRCLYEISPKIEIQPYHTSTHRQLDGATYWRLGSAKKHITRPSQTRSCSL
jgi:hypothetical protein